MIQYESALDVELKLAQFKKWAVFSAAAKNVDNYV